MQVKADLRSLDMMSRDYYGSSGKDRTAKAGTPSEDRPQKDSTTESDESHLHGGSWPNL